MNLREKVLSLLFEREAAPEEPSKDATTTVPVSQGPAPVEEQPVEPAPQVAFAPGHCPRCGSALWKEFSSGWRCQQCGFQSSPQQATGVSRADFEQGNYDARRIRINSGEFIQAKARLLR